MNEDALVDWWTPSGWQRLKVPQAWRDLWAGDVKWKSEAEQLEVYAKAGYPRRWYWDGLSGADQVEVYVASDHTHMKAKV